MKTKKQPLFQCLECGKTYAATRSRCSCGGVDIDVYVPAAVQEIAGVPKTPDHDTVQVECSNTLKDRWPTEEELRYSEKRMAERVYERTVRNGREVLDGMRKRLMEAAEEIERYMKRYDEASVPEPRTAEVSWVMPETVLGWAVNSVGSLYSNMRLDLMVTTAAEIAESRNEMTKGSER